MQLYDKLSAFFKKTGAGLLSVLPYLFFVLMIFSFDEIWMAVLTVISAVIHEAGHVVALLAVGGEFSLYGTVSGPRLRSGKMLSYKEELAVALSGPMLNIIVFIFLLLIKSEGYIFIFALLNLITALSNLLCIQGYDGYRIMTCILILAGKERYCEIALFRISFLFSAILSFFSLYFISRFNSGYWSFFVFIFFLFKAVKNDGKVFFKRKREKKRAFKSF